MNEVADALRLLLIRDFEPTELAITDESHLHAGHAGARGGGGHFRVWIVSERFDGLAQVARHRLIYQTLGSLMSTKIHALAIEARTDRELAEKATPDASHGNP